MFDLDGARSGPSLVVRQVSKSFGGVTVLKDVDLVVRRASVHALVGHNGSGKSTFIKALAGYHAPDRPVTGTAFNRQFVLGDHVSAALAGLRFVHQDLGLVDQLNTVDNIALGPGFPQRRGRTIHWGAAVRRARTAMNTLGYDFDVNAPVGRLSASERTGVAIARALHGWADAPSVVVLDEPTAAMPANEVARLFGALDRLRAQGLGIVYVSHNLDEVLALADDVTVLRNGEVVMAREAAGLTHDDLVRSIVGRDLASLHPASAEAHDAQRPVLLDIDGLTTRALHGVSWCVRAGEIVGLAGIVGSGRDEALPAIAGAVPRRGSVRVGGNVVAPAKPREAIRAGLGLVPANRREAAVLPTFDAASNLTVSDLRCHTRRGLLNHKAEARDARGWFDRLSVSPPLPKAPILTFSGGNQQKVIVGRWLRRNPTVLALDEPTQGVDVGARRTIYDALRQMSEAGNGVLISSSDADELAALCNRVVVIVRGHVVAELTGSQLTADRIDAISLDDRGASRS